MGLPFPKPKHGTFGSNYKAIKPGVSISFPKKAIPVHSARKAHEPMKIHLYVPYTIYPSMGPFYWHLLAMGCHKNLEIVILFPFLPFPPSFFSSFKFLPIVKPQQEGESNGFSY